MLTEKKHFRGHGQNGQSYVEYTIILSLVAIACITVYALFGQQLRVDVARSGFELAGKTGSTSQSPSSPPINANRPGSNAPDDSTSDNSSTLERYLDDTMEQIVYGNFTDKATLLGVAAEIAMAAFGVDLPMDIRDLTADIVNFEFSAGHIFQTTLDAAGVLPVLGAVIKLKKLAKAVELRKGSKIEMPVPCFTAGTLVQTDKGLKPIEMIGAGDRVLARNANSGNQGYRRVTQRFVTSNQPVLKLSVVSPSGGETFNVTYHHPFHVKNRGWVAAGELLLGDEIFTSSGGRLKVADSTWLSTRQTVYNLKVQEYHTYFVGKMGLWVHNGSNKKNACGVDGNDLIKRSDIFQKHNEEINKLIDELTYAKRGNVDLKIPGGVTGAIRHTKRTGELVGGSDHIQKGRDILKKLKKIKKRIENANSLSSDEKKILLDKIKIHIDDLTDALNS